MLSSTRQTTLPLNSDAIGESFLRTLFCRAFCPGSYTNTKNQSWNSSRFLIVKLTMNVRKMYRFFTRAFDSGFESSAASVAAAVLLV